MRALPSMFGGVRDDNRNRVFALAAAGLMHVAALALLLTGGQMDRAVPQKGLSLFDLPLAPSAMSAATPAPAKQALEQPVSEPAKADVPDPTPVAIMSLPSILASPAQPSAPVLHLPLPVVTAMLAAADGTAAGGSCDLTEPVQAALRTSSDVQTAVPKIPRSERSVANAIMVWNNHWIGQDQHMPPLATIAVRDVIAATIAAATPACRLQIQAGPRLLTLPGTPQTTVLALGSGHWRWQDLLNTAFPDSPSNELGRPIDVTPQFAFSIYASSQ